MTKEEIWLVYSTFPTREKALFAAKELLAEKLIACANIYDGVLSVYRWEGVLCEEQEATLMAKTSAEKRERAIAALKALHPYQLPCIVAYPAGGGLPDFLQWVAEETR